MDSTENLSQFATVADIGSSTSPDIEAGLVGSCRCNTSSPETILFPVAKRGGMDLVPGLNQLRTEYEVLDMSQNGRRVPSGVELFRKAVAAATEKGIDIGGLYTAVCVHLDGSGRHVNCRVFARRTY